MKPIVLIKNPLLSTGHEHTIKGWSSKKDASIQVLVLANDGQWYIQKDPVVNGHDWTCDIKVGYPDSKGIYLVVAVLNDGTPKITKCPIKITPEDTTHMVYSNHAICLRA